jgi:hypothetical protein
LGKDPAETYFRTLQRGTATNANRHGRDLKGFDPAALARDNLTQAIYFVTGNAIGATGTKVVKLKDGTTETRPTGCVIDDDCPTSSAFFVEWDSPDQPIEWQLQAWQELGLPEPSAMVRTGGKSVHCYWVLREPLSRAEWEPIQKRLIAYCRGDASCKNISRLMRVPGFDYIDKATGRPNGNRAELIHTSEARYSLPELEQCIPAAEPSPPPSLPLLQAPRPALMVSGARVPFRDFLSKEAASLIDTGSREGSCNADGLRLSMELVAVEGWLAQQGATADETALEAYMAYLSHCPDTINGAPFDTRVALARFDGAVDQHPTPATPEEKLLQRLAFHRREPGRPACKVLPFSVARSAHIQLEGPGTGSTPDGEIDSIEKVVDQGAAIGSDGPSPAHVLDVLLGPAEEGKLRRPRTDKLTQALGLILPIRYNLLTGRIEHNGRAIHGDYLGGLYLELAEEHQLDVTKDRAIDAAIRVARKHAYHPVRDYLNSITTALPIEDWAAIDVRCFGKEDQTGMAGLHLQRQLVGLVARAMQPGCELQTALVIHSDRQGIGKSSFWRILGGEWFSDSLGDLRNLKDDLLQLHAAWIHEWGEIDMVMGKQESEALKRFLSASRDDVRKPYGRGVETLLRSCGIVGTTNRRDFIKDPTGNRRFPIISISGVDLGWVTANRDAIWGSAVAAYRSGTRWRYDGAENTLVSANALAFAPEDPLRERIEAWAEDHPAIAEAPLVQILKDLQLDTEDQSIRSKAGNALTSLGWTRTEKKARFDLPWGGRTNSTYGWRRPA